MSLLGDLRTHYRDARHFGPAVLMRAVHTPDVDGYTSIHTPFGSFLIRHHDTDFKVLRQVFIDREYDLDRFPQGKLVRRIYVDSLERRKTPLIIDAGANAGFAARFFAIAYPGASIFAVEPDPANAAVCRKNVESLPQIKVVEAAIGARPGHVSLERREGDAWGTRTHRAEEGVPVVTINDLQSEMPDSELLIVKVDIEGFERDLFSENIEWIAQTCALIVEPHDWMLAGAGTSQALQRAMLDSNRDLLISGENLVWIKQT